MESVWSVVDGLRIHTRVSVRPPLWSDPPIVLVHGLIVSSRYMVPTAKRLGAYYPVYAPDLPGFGRSDYPPEVPSVPALADALAAWMDAMGLPRAVLLGNSMGCQIVAHFAARHPRRIERAVLVGPTMDAGARNLFVQAARWLADIPLERPSSWGVHLRDCRDFRLWRIPRMIRHGLEDRIEETLPFLEVPTLVVRGGRDPIVPQRWAEEVTRLLPNARLVVVPGAPHCVNYSAADALTGLVQAFLATRQSAFLPGRRVPRD